MVLLFLDNINGSLVMKYLTLAANQGNSLQPSNTTPAWLLQRFSFDHFMMNYIYDELHFMMNYIMMNYIYDELRL